MSTRRLTLVKVNPKLQQPKLNNAWLSGFTDAEGCFFCNFQNQSTFLD
jgi:hypothetical protein